jgi:endoglucanase
MKSLLMNIIAFLLLSIQLCSYAQTASASIRLNQVAFSTAGLKEAVVANTTANKFYVVTAYSGDTVFTGTLSDAKLWSYSNETVKIANFSGVDLPGKYAIKVPPDLTSYTFDILDRPFLAPGKAAMKGYYYQRASEALLSQYAYQWARKAGHPDTIVLVHPSAATALRPANTVIKAPKGWYDAGDYNKYIVNSGISMFTIFSMYEQYSKFLDTVSLNIPESGNGVPDVLNEAMWNLQWMLAMQDPNDGGVYHKLTNANFDGFIMPSAAVTTRYVVQKSTAATLDFAAVMAMAARIYKPYSSQFPGLADQCLSAAKAAWQWAGKNMAVFYNQTTLNSQYSPQIATGEYGDGYVIDEFNWAGIELYITTKDDSYIQGRLASLPTSLDVPYWGGVNTLGFISLAANKNNLTAVVDTSALFARLLTLANSLAASRENSAFHTAMGVSSGDFTWGSNSTAANQGMILLAAYNLRKDQKYYNAALANADYLLGRNGPGYCFLTGFGSKKVMHPHHRVSESDGVTEPVPGLLAGGVNPGQEDKCSGYVSSLPALSYMDAVCSYSTNEIAINWNAPCAFLLLGLEAANPNLVTSVKPTGQLKDFYLKQNYPNPFNPSTSISYSLTKRQNVSLKIFDILGNEIMTLVNKEEPAGQYAVKFNADKRSSGVYIYRLRTESFMETKKMVLLK